MQAKMLIFINVAPGENNKEESMNTLHFGQRIKQVERIYLSRASRNG